MAHYNIHAAQLGSTVLPGVTGRSTVLNLDAHKPESAGLVFPTFAGVKRVGRSVSLTTTALKQVLGLLTFGGPAPFADLNTSNLTVWSAKQADLAAGNASGTVHERQVFSKGGIYLDQIAWSRQGEAASVSLTAFPLSTNGLLSPVTAAASTLPDLSAEDDFDLHTLTLGGVDVAAASGLSVTPGSQPRLFFKPGGIFPTEVRSDGMANPMARVTTEDESLIRIWGDSFRSGSNATLVATFKDFSPAAATRGTQTVTVTLVGVAQWVDSTPGRPGSSGLLVHGLSVDGVTSPLTVETA